MLKNLLFSLLLLPFVCFAQTEDETGSDVSVADAKALLEHHNMARKEVKTPEMKWSAKVAAHAQEWADSMVAMGCKFEHRQGNIYGENIFMSSANEEFKPVTASYTWYKEKEKFKYSKFGDGDWQSSGHYTQMIWKTSTELGVGMATCENGNIIVVANYNPGGNMTGDYPYDK